MKRIAQAVLLLGLAALAAVLWHRYTRPSLTPEPGNRIGQLKQLAEQRGREADESLAAYTPKATGRIDDLAATAAEILQRLPAVVLVEVPEPVHRPASRIVHIRDWHFVPRNLYAIDLRSASSKPLSDAEIDAAHEELLLEAEIVQLEQLTLLRCLIRHHGLRRVFSEGMSKEDCLSYRPSEAMATAIVRLCVSSPINAFELVIPYLL